MMSGIRIALGAVALAGVAACSEPLLPEAPVTVRVDTLSLYAFNGTPRTVPNALSIYARQAVPISTSYGFDIAFDIDDQGRAVVYPVQLLVSGLGGRTGLQLRPDGSFDELRKAPLADYVFDQALTASVGSVIAIQTVEEACPYFAPLLYGKLAIDSILPAERRLRVRFLANPNCGYVSLEPGRARE